jgi:outer membrane receptor for monomeric catechols
MGKHRGSVEWPGIQFHECRNTEIKGVEFSVSGTGSISKNCRLDVMAGYTYMDPRQVSYSEAYVNKVGQEQYMGSDSSDFLKYRYKHLVRVDAEASVKKISIGASARYNSFMQNIDKVFTEPAVVPGVANYRKTGRWRPGI